MKPKVIPARVAIETTFSPVVSQFGPGMQVRIEVETTNRTAPYLITRFLSIEDLMMRTGFDWMIGTMLSALRTELGFTLPEDDIGNETRNQP